MKRLKRLAIGILVSIMMTLQLCNVVMAKQDSSMEKPEQLNGMLCKSIPVYYNGKQVTEFQTFLRKYNDTAQNSNQRFDISGIATFRVRAYAYKSAGESEVKLGTYIECLDKDGKWVFMDWRDREDQINSNDLKNYFDNKSELNIEITKVKIVDKDDKYGSSEQNDLRPLFYMKASTGGEFDRPCNKNVIFSKTVAAHRTVNEVPGKKNIWEVTVTIDNSEFHKENKHLKQIIYTDEASQWFKILEVTNRRSPSDKVELNENKLTYYMNNITNGEDNIGEFKYTIEMVDGEIGQDYPISEYAEVNYTFPSDKDNYKQSTSNGALENPFLKPLWAKVTVNHKDDKDVQIKKQDGGSYNFDVWENVENKSELTVSPVTLINTSTMEMSNEGIAICEYVSIPKYICLGIKVPDGKYSLTQSVTTKHIYSEMILYYKNDGTEKNLTVGIKVNSNGEIKDTYEATYTGNENIERILKGGELIVAKNSFIGVEVEGANLAQQQYTIIKDNKPSLPVTDAIWTDLGKLKESQYNVQENYPDMMLDKQGYISTKHYDYSGDHTTREVTFGNPIGESLVLQKATASGNKWYSEKADAYGFFENSKLNDFGGENKAVKFWGYIKPTGIEKGEFNLGSNSDDGAYGYIISGDKKVEFVNDWTIKAAFDRTNGANITLEPGKVYPIYMEWYEGQQSYKAFKPVYKKADGKDKFKPMPQEWFYPSSNTEPGDINTAYFVPKTASNIPLGEEPGTYYVVIEVKDKSGNTNQLSYGPVKIEDNKPTTIGGENKNYIVPCSISNMYWEATFADDYKDLSYEIDLDEVCKDSVISFDVDKKAVDMQPKTGDYTIVAKENKIIINFNKSLSEICTLGTEGYNLKTTIYLGTELGKDIDYNKYIEHYCNTSKIVNAKLKIVGKKKHVNQTVLADGTINEEIVYGPDNEVIKEGQKIEMKFQEIPKIN